MLRAIRAKRSRKKRKVDQVATYAITTHKEEIDRRNFTIDLIWTKIQVAVTALGGWIGYFVGGMDGLLTTLIIFMGIDYITGLMCAVADKKLSSAVGFKGIFKKVLIVMLVGIAHMWICMSLEPARRCAVPWFAFTFPMRA